MSVGAAFSDYKDLEFQLYDCLSQVIDLSRDSGGPDEERAALVECSDRIRTRRYRVAVVGEFRRGKSSLINALLGLRVLPADVTPTTATVNRITYGTVPRAVLHLRSGEKQPVPIEDLAQYVTKTDARREAVARTIEEAVVEYPIVLCQNHVDIIDTPGLADDDEMTGITVELLKRVDAAIVAVSALIPFSETEARFVAELIRRQHIGYIIFAVTFIDQIDEEDRERLLDSIRGRIHDMVLGELAGAPADIADKAARLLAPVRLFGLSAALALDSFATNDAAALEESRFPRFKEELLGLLTSQQTVSVVENAVFAVEASTKAIAERRQAESLRASDSAALADGIRARLDDWTAAVPAGCERPLVAVEDALAAIRGDLGLLPRRLLSVLIADLGSAQAGAHDAFVEAEMERCAAALAGHLAELERRGLAAFADVWSAFGADAADHFAPLGTQPEPGPSIVAGLAGLPAPDPVGVAFPTFGWRARPILPAGQISDLGLMNAFQRAAEASLAEVTAQFDAWRDAARVAYFRGVDAHLAALRELVTARVADLQVEDAVTASMRERDAAHEAEESARVLARARALLAQVRAEERAPTPTSPPGEPTGGGGGAA